MLREGHNCTRNASCFYMREVFKNSGAIFLRYLMEGERLVGEGAGVSVGVVGVAVSGWGCEVK
jgi:hypothetical protein